jgi:ubiquinone/menaquinone biosynthesis C-methylase UbiE
VTNEGNTIGLPWLKQVSSFQSSRIILTANNYRIFDHLEEKEKTAASVSQAIATDRRATALLLDSLVAIGLIKKKDGRYKNTLIASRYLIKGKPEYQGDILGHNNILWDNWSGLDTVLKTGKPFKKSHDHTSFILGMHNLASLKVKNVLQNIDLKGVKRLLDLGGGPGTYSIAFAKKKIDVTLFDFPDTLKISKKLVKEAGLSGNIKLLPGDFTRDDLGKGYDLIFISQIFHAYGPDECLSMLRKSHKALTPGGRVIIQEFYLDETRTSPFQGALFAINMLVNTPRGRTYTQREIFSWMKKAGFADIQNKILGETALTAGIKQEPRK